MVSQTASKQQGLLSRKHMKGRFGTQDIQHGITDLPIDIKQATQTPPVESPHLPRHVSAHTTLWVKDGHTPNSTPVQQHTPNKCLKQGKACLAITPAQRRQLAL